MWFPIDEITGSAVHISNLKLVGHYSIDSERNYCNDLSQLKYYKPPSKSENVNMDLNKGLDSTIFKPIQFRNDDALFRWILENVDNIKIQDTQIPAKRWLQPEIVCYRGLLKNIMITPYNRENGWIICASKFQGTIYLCDFDTDVKKQRILNETAEDRRLCSYGFKFEQYMMSGKPSDNPDTTVPVNHNEEFDCVFQSYFGKLSLLYGAEMDGVCSQQQIKDTLVGKEIEFVELKTIKTKFLQRNGTINWRKSMTLLSWWCQSYLVNVQRIICGFKSEIGVVEKIQEFQLSELARCQEWMDSSCRIFCDRFLNFIVKTVQQDHDKCIYKFTLNSNDSSVITVDYITPEPSCEYTVLPKWFTDEMVKKRNNA